MGRSGELKRPALGSGPLKKLNDALHELHLMAGLPSLTAMHKAVGKRISRSALHDALTSPARPAWDTVDALIQILADKAPNATPERELNRVHQLWVSIVPGRLGRSRGVFVGPRRLPRLRPRCDPAAWT